VDVDPRDGVAVRAFPQLAADLNYPGLLCHNVVVVHQAIVELGIEGTFWPANDDGQKDLLPLIRRG